MKYAFIIIALVTLVAISVFSMLGEGGLKRMVTISGIYSICKPDNYPVVCFLDSDGKEGGMFCLPLSQVGNKCNPKSE